MTHIADPMAELLIDDRHPLSKDELIEITVWKVPKSKAYPDGVKYSMHYQKSIDGKFVSVLRYDNHEGHMGRSHHIHRKNQVFENEYRGWKDLLWRFNKEVKMMRQD